MGKEASILDVIGQSPKPIIKSDVTQTSIVRLITLKKPANKATERSS